MRARTTPPRAGTTTGSRATAARTLGTASTPTAFEFALDAALDLPPNVDADALVAEVDGHVLAEAELTGTYAP